MQYIAFVCGHNSGRSQMAQAAFNHLKLTSPEVDSNFEAISWGTGIASSVNSKVIPIMAELGIDLGNSSLYFPKDLDHPMVQQRLASVIKLITMGCMEKQCEVPSGSSLSSNSISDWGLADPAKDETDVAAVRDSILGKSLQLIRELAEG